jgi:hypothetical protein
LKRSYQAYDNYVGSVLCLEFGTDLNLNPLLAPGVRGNFQLSLDVKYRDVRDTSRTPEKNNLDSTDPLPYKAFLVIVPIGVMTIENQLITTSIGSITEQDMLAAPWLASGYRRAAKDFYGSGMDAKNIFKIVNAIRKHGQNIGSPAATLAGEVLNLSSNPTAQAVGSVLRQVGQHTRPKGRGRASGGAQTRCASLQRRM